MQQHKDDEWPKTICCHLTVSGAEPVFETVEDLRKSLVDVDRDLPGVRQLLLNDRQLGLEGGRSWRAVQC